MHLLLGDPQDVCCQEVRDALAARGFASHVISNPVVHPSRFCWSFNSEQSESSLAWDGQEPVPDGDIAGVFVHSTGWIDPAGWRPSDLMYVQAETQAAVLAWIWSLECPVVNRYPPAVWYRPHAPLLSWYGLLKRSGLSTLDVLVTNIEQEARAFGARLAEQDLSGVVCGALTSDARFLVSSEDDWRGVAALQRTSPVCFVVPHAETLPVCVVGNQVVWDETPTPEFAALEPALLAFAAAAGLQFVGLTLAATPRGVCVVSVETRPLLNRFGDAPRRLVVGEIVRLLTVEDRPRRELGANGRLR